MQGFKGLLSTAKTAEVRMDNRAVRAWRRIVAVEKPKLNPIRPMLAVLNGLQCPSENDRCPGS